MILNKWCRDISNKQRRKNKINITVQARINQIQNKKIYKVIKHQNNLQYKVRKVKMFLMLVKQVIEIVVIINKVKNHKNQIRLITKVT